MTQHVMQIFVRRRRIQRHEDRAGFRGGQERDDAQVRVHGDNGDAIALVHAALHGGLREQRAHLIERGVSPVRVIRTRARLLSGNTDARDASSVGMVSACGG